MRTFVHLLLRGFRGHPNHPPLTDVAVGAFTVATVALVLGAAGWRPGLFGSGAWVALVVGLLAAIPTAVTGFADLLAIPANRAARSTAILHMSLVVGAVGLYLVAWLLLRPAMEAEAVPASAGWVSVAAFLLLAGGGWVGGSLTFVHGVRVVGDENVSTASAVKPRLPGANDPRP